LSAFVPEPARVELWVGQLCDWVDHLTYHLGLEISDEKQSQDYRNANGAPFFTAAEASDYDQIMARFRRFNPALLNEMIACTLRCQEFYKKCEKDPGYFSALCGCDEAEIDPEPDELDH
jgi:hypothetical protein